MARRKKFRIPGLTFSYKRAFGITKAKRKVARFTGIPTSRSGRRAKIGRMVTGGCLLSVISYILIFVGCIGLIIWLI